MPSATGLGLLSQDPRLTTGDRRAISQQARPAIGTIFQIRFRSSSNKHREERATHLSRRVVITFCPQLFCPNPGVLPACREEFAPAGLKQAHLPFQFLGALCGLEAVFPPVCPEKWWCDPCFVVNHRVDWRRLVLGHSRAETVQ